MCPRKQQSAIATWQSAARRITSRENSLLRQARAAREGKIKDLIFVEGLRLCEEALQSGLRIEAVIFSDAIPPKERAGRFLADVSPVCSRLGIVSEKLLATISYTKTPQGIIVLAERPESSSSVLRVRAHQPSLLVVLQGTNNPVNVGAILRSAEAAGATGAITTSQTADPFSPKALRGAMGSAFRLPIWQGATYAEALQWCVANGIRTVCADLDAKAVHTEIDWRIPSALIVGPESAGLSDEEVLMADEAVRIEMHGKVESLNVAVASAILLYEAARQRSN